MRFMRDRCAWELGQMRDAELTQRPETFRGDSSQSRPGLRVGKLMGAPDAPGLERVALAKVRAGLLAVTGLLQMSSEGEGLGR